MLKNEESDLRQKLKRNLECQLSILKNELSSQSGLNVGDLIEFDKVRGVVKGKIVGYDVTNEHLYGFKYSMFNKDGSVSKQERTLYMSMVKSVRKVNN